ncbi:sterol-sensing domain of SREBP cleavage-activation-domain-containing protein [Dactylonectria estremocensis]|uniref:Sterol regulatory element-binding protein cleavage-activating protein n=1 Tax=Dactylonectria estremocensis TaxID=1079267 RepID=A0A9P9F5A1_9HYPO|nr:sterol-sensing domain of SREBP cleavage-activation-domain-containing protein [Dactylonectria estremocensis]
MFIYPIPFLFTTDFINGASNLPHHAWTVAQPLPYGVAIHPDVMMRSIWVHSSYMQALDQSLLSSALDLQDELLGSTRSFNPSRARNEDRLLPQDSNIDLSPTQRDAFHAINGLTNQSWFFHSPLQYWDCSRERILSDPDILTTVNDRKNQSTSVNVTLRHSIVFSGKRFEERRLIAADALVITLIYLRDSPIGRQWERKVAMIPEKFAVKWDVYPPDGRVSSSQLYEFHFRPISRQDSVILSIAYSMTVVYFFMSLSKLRAFKSKFGLILTVVTQIAFSLMSSFTICAIFRIDLSRIPRAAYPLVVLAMSLENIFRLINAVILTPSEDSTSSRIGHAFGDTAHTAITSSTQNFLLLVALSRCVSPGVSAFCIFAATAIVFDLFYLSTFFLSVLSVDVRRTELSDALAKASMRHNWTAAEAKTHSTWDHFLRGKVTMSTRIAGTIVMLGFVLIAQWHFFEDDTIFHFLGRMLRNSTHNVPMISNKSPLDEIHQARSPKSWLRLQDHETAQEIISIIKPSAHSYVARVYEPVVFVMKGSDRMPHFKEPALLPAAYDFINHQLTRFLVIVVVVIAAIRLLTNYLLWEDNADGDDDHHLGSEPLLSVKSFTGGHFLDIAMLAASPDGHVVSVGLDRFIRIWDVRPGGLNYVIADGGKNGEAPFPVLAMAVDSNSEWLAILSSSKVVLWNLKERTWGPTLPVNIVGQKPEAFFFTTPDQKGDIPRLVLVRRNGTLTEFIPGNGEGADFGVCRSPLTCVQPLVGIASKQSSPGKVSVITASRRGCVHAATREPLSWKSSSVELTGLDSDGVHQVVPLPSLGLFLIAGVTRVHLVNLEDHALIHTFKTESISPRSLQSAHSPRQAAQTGVGGLTWLTLCYTEAETGDCIIHTYVPPEDSDLICFDSSATPISRGWCSWDSAKETRRHVENPGTWDIVSDGSVVGIRQKLGQSNNMLGEGRRRSEGLRHRSPRKEPSRDVFGRWEAWTAPQSYRMRTDETRPLFQNDEKSGHLMVSELGPMIQVGQRSVAFSFGNVVKVMTVGGHERFEVSTGKSDREQLNMGSRRRKMGVASRPRAWS